MRNNTFYLQKIRLFFTKNIYKKIILTILTIFVIGIASIAYLPITVEAGIFEILVGGGLQMAKINEQLNYFNNEGRHELFAHLKEQHGVLEDEDINARVDVIMQKVSQGIAKVDPSINKKPYNYFVNPNENFNAFCTLGHNVSINKGLFDLLVDDNEIAVVVAHEMGHGQKDHVLKGFKKRIPVKLGAQILLESQGYSLGSAILTTIIETNIEALNITKPMEWEADNLAFDYIVHAGYNPGACAALWQRVEEKQQTHGRGNFIGEIFSPSDHPTNEQRLKNYQKLLYKYSNEKIKVADGVVFVNGNKFVETTGDDHMSKKERAFFIAGNLSAVCHNHEKELPQAAIKNGMVILGVQEIMFPKPSEGTAEELAKKLNTCLAEKNDKRQ